MSVPPVAGARLGTYRLVRPVGRGGFGQVWLAEDPHAARVAVKVLQQPDGVGPDQSFRSWFTREYRTGSRVDSRFIATPFDADLEAEPPWIAFRYVEGRTLRSLIDSEPLTPARTALIAVQILRGLSELHEAGLVHRDIKPENIMISPGDHVTILDLGIVHDPTATKVSRDAQLGTPGYLAPEAVQGLATGPAMDIWAFAVTVVDMLCPERRYTGAHPVQAVRGVHSGWADVVAACMAHDPDRRPAAPTVIALITAIRHAIDSVTAPERGAPERTPPNVGDPETLAPIPMPATQPAPTSVTERQRPLLADNSPDAATVLASDEPVVTAQSAALRTGHVQRPPAPAPIERRAQAAEGMASEAAIVGGTPVPVAAPKSPRRKTTIKSVVVGLAVTVILTAVPLSAIAAIQSGDTAQDDDIETMNAGGAGPQPSGEPSPVTSHVATPQPADNGKPAAQPPAERVTPQQAAQHAVLALKQRHPKHQFSRIVSNGDEPWLISINGAAVTEWRWNDKQARWNDVTWAPAGNLTFTDIVRQDVTDDGRDDFILKARDASGHTFGSVLVNQRSQADWADMRGLDGAKHGAANYLQLGGSTLISDYRAHGTRTKVGSHPRTTWRYQGYDHGYPLFVETPA